MTSSSAIVLVFATALSVSAFSACRAQEDVLDAIFRCNLDEGDAQCGTDENDKPMTCYVGSAQLGGTAFCAKTCDPARPTDDRHVCTSSGALLQRCHPDKNDIACPGPLQCYRTDVLLEDDGLCLWVPICPYSSDERKELDNAQCTLTHQVCAGSLLADLSSLRLRINNLHCVATPSCEMFDCPQIPLTEACPTEFYDPNAGIPVTCAVQCDKFACPPNFTCIGRSSPDAPPVCLPGVLGIRCASNEDCITGDCLDTGAGFSVCTLEGGCDNDGECSFIGSNPAFVCAKSAPDERGHCVVTTPFQGANCAEPSDCAEELRCGDEACPPRDCFHYSPPGAVLLHGECRFKCDPAVGCKAFGGLPHVCLPDGGCYPGSFGVPCTKSPSPECIANLSCATIPLDERSDSEDSNICTVSCNDDDDCTALANPWLGNGGYCATAPDPAPGTAGYCRIGAQPGLPCEKPAHCLYRICDMTGSVDGVGTCAEAP